MTIPPTSARWLALGALLCALSIGAGAFGAHALASRLDERSLALWETASRYLIYGGFGLCVVGLLGGLSGGSSASQLLTTSGVCLAIGSLIFSGTVAGLALGGPRWLGAVTPLGGLGLIIGYLLLAAAAIKSS